jgi:hypothetical protein
LPPTQILQVAEAPIRMTELRRSRRFEAVGFARDDKRSAKSSASRSSREDALERGAKKANVGLRLSRAERLPFEHNGRRFARMGQDSLPGSAGIPAGPSNSAFFDLEDRAGGIDLRPEMVADADQESGSRRCLLWAIAGDPAI